MTPGRRLLPLLTSHSPNRASITCKYRCANQCSHEPPNTSDNEYFGDVVRGVLDRRGALKAGVVLGAAGAGLTALSGAAAAAPGGPAPAAAEASRRAKKGLGFQPVAPNSADRVVTPPGYTSDILIRWGDPVLPGAPKFNFDRQSAAAQAQQFGYNNDFCELAPLGRNTWLMGSNHEYTTESMMHIDYDEENPTREQVRISWAAHGFSVVVVRRDPRTGKMRATVDKKYNRRFTVFSPFRLTGPAAGSKHVRTSEDRSGRTVFGTFNNCAGGLTPWGTFLSGEENVNGYFANADKVSDEEAKARLDRYGFGAGASDRKWERFDRRFDLAKEPNEANRFGWIVEIDPHDPNSVPKKHTALGRFKHEGATIRVNYDGRVVVYLGDDEGFEYIYKYVSKGRMLPGNSARARRHNSKLLEDGTLYAARLYGNSPDAQIDGSGKLPKDGEFDGTGEWMPLASGDRSFVEGFTAEEVYVFTRAAADVAGATKMDRPEDVQPNPKTGRVYAALTNNTGRGPGGRERATEPNPRNANKDGHVLELAERNNDGAARRFSWNLLLVCGDPKRADTYFGGYDKTKVSPISCPDNLAFDDDGNLWISTDGSSVGNDALHAVPLEGAERGHVQTFLTVPKGAEACGPVVHKDFVLVSVQHPGEVDDASASNPISNWPDRGDTNPRPSVVYVRKTHR